MQTLTVCRMLTLTRGAYDGVAAAFPLSARQILLNLQNRAQEARSACSFHGFERSKCMGHVLDELVLNSALAVPLLYKALSCWTVQVVDLRFRGDRNRSLLDR